MVMIAVRPHKKDAVRGTSGYLFLDLRLIQRRPVMRATSDPAGRGNRATDAVLQYPQSGDGRLIVPIRVVGIGEVLMPLEIEGWPRRDASMGSNRNHVGGKEDRLCRVAAITDNVVK